MENYQWICEVGRGSFGSVHRAIHKKSSEVVAIKIMKQAYKTWEECLSLPEVKILRRLNNHPNIIQLKEVISENNMLYLVFEFMECDLLHLMKDRQNQRGYFSESEIRNLCFQIFQGLVYMHKEGYFHRDLKPENLLIRCGKVKIADFGLAKEINSPPPYTDYVMTRWYRAPEVLLCSYLYSSKVDMWSMGAIMAELFTFTPLFPGNTEADQMYKICKFIGTPTKESWSDGIDLARNINYQFPELGGTHFSLLMRKASKDAASLIKWLCSWDPCKRPTAAEALQHPFFQSCIFIPKVLRIPELPDLNTSICWNKEETEAAGCQIDGI